MGTAPGVALPGKDCTGKQISEHHVLPSKTDCYDLSMRRKNIQKSQKTGTKTKTEKALVGLYKKDS